MMEQDIDCPEKVLAARVTALLDSVRHVDNSRAIEEAFGVDDALHYASYWSKLEYERGQVYGPINTDKMLKSPFEGQLFKGKIAQTKGGSLANTTVNFVTGNHPDFNIRPSEILGDDIVRPVENSYRKYAEMVTNDKEIGSLDLKLIKSEEQFLKHRDLMERLEDLREESGLYDALDDAKDLITDLFEESDFHRYQYGMQWLNSIERPIGDRNILEKYVSWESQTVVSNLLRNNLVSALRNHFDRVRALYQFGFKHYREGQKLYAQAVKDKGSDSYRELEKAGVLGSRFFEETRFDLFSASEPGNKGITYFAAKQHALSSGMRETKAKLYARNAVEQLQFQGSYVNRPKVFWSNTGRTNLSLLSFTLGERRWYLSQWEGLLKAAGDMRKGVEGSGARFKSYAKVLAYYTIGNAIINGPTAAIPEEFAQIAKQAFPEHWDAVKDYDRYGLIPLLTGADLADVSRVPLTNIGILTKIPVVYDTLKSGFTNLKRAYDHPTKSTLMKAAQTVGLLLPSGLGIPGLRNVGNKQLGAMGEFLYRYATDYYEHRTPKGKVYRTDAVEEFFKALRGGRESFDRKRMREERGKREAIPTIPPRLQALPRMTGTQ